MAAYIFSNKFIFYAGKGLGVFSIVFFIQQNTMKKTPKKPNEFICEECNFKCCNKKDYARHLSTRKHLNTTNTTNTQQQNAKIFVCECGKVYGYRASLFNHKKKCNPPKEENAPKEDERDKLINLLFKEKKEMMEENKEMMEEKKEMKDLVLLLVKNLQEVMPHIGGGHNNTTGDHNNLTNCNNTLNFYLTNTCKDAESLTEFTSRFCERIETFFNGNYQKIANNQSDLAKEVQELFFECLEDKPQVNKFIQTTDTKNGIYYVKEPNKVEKELTFGDSKFVKYKDGFEKTGIRIGHEINKVLQPCRNECVKELKKGLVSKPNEEDYEDFDEYEKAKDEYYKSTVTVEENFMFQTYNAMNIFDDKKTKDKVLTGTKRPKQMY